MFPKVQLLNQIRKLRLNLQCKFVESISTKTFMESKGSNQSVLFIIWEISYIIQKVRIASSIVSEMNADMFVKTVDKNESVFEDVLCTIDGSGDEKCSCRDLLREIGSAFQKIPDISEECDCFAFECENPAQCELIRLSGPCIDEQINFIKANSFVFNCENLTSAKVKESLALLFKTSKKTKLYLNAVNLDGLRSGQRLSKDGEITHFWTIGEFWRGEKDPQEREKLMKLMDTIKPKTFEESEQILIKYTSPCEVGCKNSLWIRKGIEHDLIDMLCALEDLMEIKNCCNSLMRSKEQNEVSVHLEDGATLDEIQKKMKRIRSFVLETCTENHLKCTCPNNSKCIQLLKIKYGDELPSFFQNQQ